jgi:exopolyphosphatase/guanosine-5'-triphosphate,3'-diphosphate pyrophosphatase
LQQVPIAQTASAVARFVALAREEEAESIRVIATSAARDARNADDLINAIRRASGLRVEIISGEQEAEWVFRGVTSDPQLPADKLLILDVGGGSTEFILGAHGHHSFRRSFPLGSVRLLEKLRPGEPPSLADLAGCREWLARFFDEQVGPAMESLLSDAVHQNVTLVGTGGATTIIARMERKLTTFDRTQIEGTRLTRQQILDYMVQLWGMSLANRKKLPGVPPNRADVIIMGVAIYEAVMEHFNMPELYVSTRGLRFGALLDSP